MECGDDGRRYTTFVVLFEVRFGLGSLIFSFRIFQDLCAVIIEKQDFIFVFWKLQKVTFENFFFFAKDLIVF